MFNNLSDTIGTPSFWVFVIGAAAVAVLFGFHFTFKGSVQFT